MWWILWLNLGLCRKNIAVMHIYYEENFFRANSKEEFIGFTDFLCEYWTDFIRKKCSPYFFVAANTGGLLGLFMGFSVVSIIEIFYFMSVRPYCAVKRRLRVGKGNQVEDSLERSNVSATKEKQKRVRLYPYTN